MMIKTLCERYNFLIAIFIVEFQLKFVFPSNYSKAVRFH